MKNVTNGKYSTISFVDDSQCIEDFIALPKKLYTAKTNPQNSGEERQLISGTHALSKYFRFVPFILHKDGITIGRAALTFYPDQPETAYLGFFEMENEKQAAAHFFCALERFAIREGYAKILGPMNASFWLGYRMKADRFEDAPYFGEPNNLPYYVDLWRENGYFTSEEYISNHYNPLSPGAYKNIRYEKRLQAFLAKGCTIRPPKKESWDTVIRDVYRLTSQLYSGFPTFSLISEDDFLRNYSGLKLILDFSVCRLAYHNGQAVALAITVPDYGNMLNNISIWKLPKMLWTRKHAKRHVVLYVGVMPEHKGLGVALAQELIQELSKKNTVPIGALIHKGKVTGGYASDFIRYQSTYLLLEKDLSDIE